MSSGNWSEKVSSSAGSGSEGVEGSHAEQDAAQGAAAAAHAHALPLYLRVGAAALGALLLGLGVVGNLLVPLVILKSKDMRTSTNIYLVNLSLADLLVLVICTPTLFLEVAKHPDVWLLGPHMCKLVPYVELLVVHASVLTILAISLERYYAICQPLKASYVCTKGRAMGTCAGAWVSAALVSSPVLGISELHEEEDADTGVTVAACLMMATSALSLLYFLLIIAVFFLLPLLVLLALYGVMARQLVADAAASAYVVSGGKDGDGGGGSLSQQQHHTRARRQVVLMLGTVVAAFFLCLTPFRCLTLWILFAPPHQAHSLSAEAYYNLLYFCRLMAYLNSAINPLLYNLMSSKFRTGFRRLCGAPKRERALLLRRRGGANMVSLTSSACGASGASGSALLSRSSDASWRSSTTASTEGSSSRGSLRHQHSLGSLPPTPCTPPFKKIHPQLAMARYLSGVGRHPEVFL